METLHAELHWMHIPVGCVAMMAASWIAGTMIRFVRRHRVQAEAVGGQSWPRLWYWYAAAMLLFGAVLFTTGLETIWPNLCILRSILSILGAGTLVITAVLLTIGTRDARTFYQSSSRQEDLHRLVSDAAHAVLREARPHGPR